MSIFSEESPGCAIQVLLPKTGSESTAFIEDVEAKVNAKTQVIKNNLRNIPHST